MDRKLMEYAQKQLKQLRQPALAGRQYEEHAQAERCETNIPDKCRHGDYTRAVSEELGKN